MVSGAAAGSSAAASAALLPEWSVHLPFPSAQAALPTVLLPAVRLGILCKFFLRCCISTRLNASAAVQIAAQRAFPEHARLADAVDKVVAFFMGMVPSLLQFTTCIKGIGLAIDHTPPCHLVSVSIQIVRTRIRLDPSSLTDTIHKKVIFSFKLYPACAGAPVSS